jgi:hypothetical protein
MCFHGGEDGPHQANERKCCVSRPLSVYSDCSFLEFSVDYCVLISAHCQEQMKSAHQCCLWWWWWCSDTLLVTMTRFWLHSCHVPFELLLWLFLCNFIDKLCFLNILHLSQLPLYQKFQRALRRLCYPFSIMRRGLVVGAAKDFPDLCMESVICSHHLVVEVGHWEPPSWILHIHVFLWYIKRLKMKSMSVCSHSFLWCNQLVVVTSGDSSNVQIGTV